MGSPKLAIILFCFLGVTLGVTEDSLQAVIARQRAEIEGLSREESDLVSYLDALSREISLVGELLDTLAARDSILNRRLAALSDSLEISLEQLDSARAAQADVVRAMYIRGRGGNWAFLLGSSDIGDFVNRVGYFLFLARARQRLADDVARHTELVDDILDSTAAVKLRVEENKALKQAEFDSLGSLRRRKRNTLEKIRADKTAYQNALAEMERSLEELRLRLPEPSAVGDFERFRGKLPWPTESKKIIHPFGIVAERRFGTNFRNAGIDIATNPDEPVHAVADGRVAQIYWLRGYGKIIILEHEGGYFSVYGNLDRVLVEMGQMVEAGTEIAATAADGWLEGAKLHFEIRKGKQEVNPVEWLIAA